MRKDSVRISLWAHLQDRATVENKPHKPTQHSFSPAQSCALHNSDSLPLGTRLSAPQPCCSTPALVLSGRCRSPPAGSSLEEGGVTEPRQQPPPSPRLAQSTRTISLTGRRGGQRQRGCHSAGRRGVAGGGMVRPAGHVLDRVGSLGAVSGPRWGRRGAAGPITPGLSAAGCWRPEGSGEGDGPHVPGQRWAAAAAARGLWHVRPRRLRTDGCRGPEGRKPWKCNVFTGEKAAQRAERRLRGLAASPCAPLLSPTKGHTAASLCLFPSAAQESPPPFFAQQVREERHFLFYRMCKQSPLAAPLRAFTRGGTCLV